MFRFILAISVIFVIVEGRGVEKDVPELVDPMEKYCGVTGSKRYVWCEETKSCVEFANICHCQDYAEDEYCKRLTRQCCDSRRVWCQSEQRCILKPLRCYCKDYASKNECRDYPQLKPVEEEVNPCPDYSDYWCPYRKQCMKKRDVCDCEDYKEHKLCK